MDEVERKGREIFERMEFVRQMMILIIENEWAVGTGSSGLFYSKCSERILAFGKEALVIVFLPNLTHSLLCFSLLSGMEVLNMGLGIHEHTKHGGFRKERSDSKAKNLRRDYPEFYKVDGRTTLGTLKERLHANSLNQVRRKLRRM